MIEWQRRDGGGERPWLLVHGYAGGPDSWNDVSARLPAPAEVAALVLPGHGRGVEVERGAGFEGNLARIATAVRDAGMRGAHFVGYSLGARVVLSLVALHRELVGRATLIGVNPGIADAAARAARRAEDARWAALLRGAGIEAFVDAWEALPLWASQVRAAPERLARQRALRLGLDPEGLAQSLEEMGLGAMPDYRGALTAAKVPVRLVVGAEDDKFGAIADGLAAVIPRLELQRVAEAGHNPLIEQPEAMARLLADDAAGR